MNSTNDFSPKDAAAAFNTLMQSLQAQPDLAARLRQEYEASIKEKLAAPTEAAPEAPPEAAQLAEAPPLPERAQIKEQHLEKAQAESGQWFGRYVAFGLEAVPRAPREYHEIFALSLGAVAIARRVCLKVGTDAIYPNLYALAIGPSSKVAKSTSWRPAERVLEAAGLAHLKLSDSVTPQSLVDELSGQKPPNFDAMAESDKALIEAGTAYAGQRAWWIDEAAQLFEAFSQEHLAAIRTLMLDLYECPDRRTHSTRGGGLRVIRHAYLNFCGPTTYAAMRKHLKHEANWQDGILARFILVTPYTVPAYTFFPPEVDLPAELPDTLRALNDKLPQPDKDRNLGAITAKLGKGVWERWEAYDRAMHDMLDKVPEQLHPNYVRMSKQAIKAALILATLDWATKARGEITITWQHWTRAQHLAESWRASLHRLLAMADHTKEDDELERIERALTAKPLSVRELGRKLGMSKAQQYNGLVPYLEKLERIGYAQRTQIKPDRGPVSCGWMRA